MKTKALMMLIPAVFAALAAAAWLGEVISVDRDSSHSVVIDFEIGGQV